MVNVLIKNIKKVTVFFLVLISNCGFASDTSVNVSFIYDIGNGCASGSFEGYRSCVDSLNSNAYQACLSAYAGYPNYIKSQCYSTEYTGSYPNTEGTTFRNGVPNKIGVSYKKTNGNGDVITNSGLISVGAECPDGYTYQSTYLGGSGNDLNYSAVCKKIEEQSCASDGDPINVSSREKFEHEIDYQSADGLLKVERFYINQFTGWSFGSPQRLVFSPDIYQNQDPNKCIGLVPFPYEFSRFTFSNSNNIYETEKYIYNFCVTPSTNNSVYWQKGTTKYRFTKVGNAFVGDGPIGLRTKLERIDPANSDGASWKLISADGSVSYFLINGNLLRTEFADGGKLIYQYDVNGLISQTDSRGRSLTYGYDADHRLMQITQPDGQLIQYSYDTDKKKIEFRLFKQVTWANGEKISYVYNEPDKVGSNATAKMALTGKFDSLGQRIDTTMYSYGLVYYNEGALGVSPRTFGGTTDSATVKDGLNSTRRYIFNTTLSDGTKLLSSTSQPAGSGCAASTKNATYYSDGLKKTETDFNGNKMQFGYEAARALETVRVDGVAANDIADYTSSGIALPAGVRKISTQWHSQLREPVKKADSRLITSYIYNGDADPFNGGQIAQCSVSNLPLLCHQVQQATTDANGQLGFSAVLDTTITKRELIYTYNAQGQLLTRKRGSSSVADETREYYDVAGVDYRVGDLKSITNALGHKTQFVAYDANGYPKKVLDANNVETQFTYDVRGRLLTQTTAQATTTHTYDVNGNRDTSLFPNGMLVDYEYDPAKRLISISNAFGEKINYEYDLESNLRFERITNSGGAVTYLKEHIYDALSREKNVVNSFNQSRTYLYDANGNSTGEIDAKSQTTSRTFNALNQLKLSTDALNGITDYSYDKKGRITEVKDPKGHATTYIYNAFGELTQQISPDTGTTTFTYYPNGNRSSATDARNVVVNYVYDALDRLKTVTYPAAASENITFSYDNTANGSYGIGRLASVSTAAARNDYEYNAQGLISKKFTQVGTLLSTTQYTYDPVGQLNGIVYPSGRSVTYVRDSQGRVQSITTKADANASAQTIAANLAYLPFGPVASYSYGNGLTHTNTFDTDYRLTAVQVGSVLSRSYGYDANDNIDSITNVIAATKNQAFGYDALDRLTSAAGIYGSLGYTYDAVGNRLTETVGTTISTYNYETTSNRLLGITAPGVTRAFAYDTAGNRTQGTTEDIKVQNYTYNKANRMATAKVGTTLVGTYTYNALGQRVGKVAGSTKESYHYDEAGQLIAVTDATGKNLREYIYNGNQLMGFVAVQATAIPTTTITLTTNQATLQNAVLAKTYSGYTGTAGYIQFNGEGQAGWPITVAATANHTVAISYALASGTIPLDLYVDGVKKTTVNFASTTAWTKWTAVNVTLNLTAGSHTLVLKTTGTGGPNLDRIRATPVAGQTTSTPNLYFVHNDHLGTPQVVTNQAKAVVWMADYQPFGKVQPGQTNSIELYSRFPGQYVDSETGNYYNYFRDYDPSIGRYLTSDPIGLEGGINTYAYVEGNPMMGIDPFGLYRYTPTAGRPVDDATARVLACMDTCVGARHPNNPALGDLVVTGATEGGHSPGSAHETAQACDIGKNSNPGLTRDDVQACYAECAGANSYGQEEGNHYHLQTRPGRGGATGFANGVH